MKRQAPRKKLARVPSSTPSAEDVLLREALDVFRTFLIRCGYEPNNYLRPLPELGVHTRDETAHFLRAKRGGSNAIIPAARLLQVWHCDPRFVANDGNPLSLPLRGEVSLATLLAEIGCAVDPAAVRKTLVDEQLVDCRRGRTKPLGRAVMGVGAARVKQVMYSLRDMLAALDHNLATDEKQSKVFQRFVFDTNVPVSRSEEYGKFFETQAMAFLINMEEWLNTAEKQARGREPLKGVNVHVFYSPREEAASQRIRRKENTLVRRTRKSVRSGTQSSGTGRGDLSGIAMAAASKE